MSNNDNNKATVKNHEMKVEVHLTITIKQL